MSEKGHGRTEKREFFLETDTGRLPQRPGWKKLNALGTVQSAVEEKGVIHTERRYFITSLKDAEEFADAARKHWLVENQLHWHLDVTFGEDGSRARKDNSPLCLNILRKVAMTLLKEVTNHRFKRWFDAAL
jgi:predicted transposase YbfD/YdcC